MPNDANPFAAPELARAVIPSTGRAVARVGLGTWKAFDVGADRERRAALAEVLRVCVAGGADVVDTSPMYGTAEGVLGDLLRETGLREKVFLATKVWTEGRGQGLSQMKESMRLLRSDRVELMQIHNLVDWRTHLVELRRMKDAGTIGLVGITHYKAQAIPDLMGVVKGEKIDFVQAALSLEEPEASEGLIQLCAERGVAFLANRPFGSGSSFARTRGRTLPDWAGDLGISSWAQFLLKWILSFPEVTCAIPATSKPEHMRDILGAAVGGLPDARVRARMADVWKSLPR